MAGGDPHQRPPGVDHDRMERERPTRQRDFVNAHLGLPPQLRSVGSESQSSGRSIDHFTRTTGICLFA